MDLIIYDRVKTLILNMHTHTHDMRPCDSLKYESAPKVKKKNELAFKTASAGPLHCLKQRARMKRHLVAEGENTNKRKKDRKERIKLNGRIHTHTIVYI